MKPAADSVRYAGFELDAGATRCEFRIEVNGKRYPFWVRSLTEGIRLHPTANAALPVALLAGMSEAQNVDLGGHAASKVMLAAMDPVQDVYCDWFEDFERIEFEHWLPWQDGDSLRDLSRGTACFFSGGADAFYTLLRHRDEIDSLLFVHGLDFAFGRKGLARQGAARRAVAEKIHEVADALGLGMVEVEVDFESLRELRIPWYSAYGAKHACIAHLLQDHFATFLASSSMTLDTLEPDGYHPDTDSAWTSEAVTLGSRGYDATRLEKLRFLADHAIARQTLRVCAGTSNDSYNCCRCEKCIRSQLALHAIGRLEDFETLDHAIDLERLRYLRIGAKTRKYHQEVVAELRRTGKDPERARELEAILALPPRPWKRFKQTGGFQQLKRVPGARRVRRWMKGR